MPERLIPERLCPYCGAKLIYKEETGRFECPNVKGFELGWIKLEPSHRTIR